MYTVPAFYSLIFFVNQFFNHKIELQLAGYFEERVGIIIQTEIYYMWSNSFCSSWLWKNITNFFDFWLIILCAVYHCNWKLLNCLYNLLYEISTLNCEHSKLEIKNIKESESCVSLEIAIIGNLTTNLSILLY